MTRTLTSSLCLAVAAVATLLFTGCKKDEASTPGGKPGGSGASSAQGALPVPPLVAECQPGIRGGRLVIATFGDPKTFNPITENEQTSRDIIRFLFLGLTDLDAPTEKVKPSLAHKWEVAEDQKTWTFHLRQGLVWSDGHPLTADDVVFTWNDVIYNPKIVSATADLFTIDGKKFAVSKVDDLTVRIVTPDVYAPFEEAWGGIPILPKHVLAKSVAEGKFESAYGIDTAPDKLVCSGPFKLKQFKAGELTLLERNPNFFAVDKAGTRLPYLDNVIYTTVPDMNAMSLRFLKGESDVFEDVRPDEYERFKTESASGRFKLEQLGVGPEKSFVWFNLNTNWVAQVKFSVDKPDAHLTIEKKKLSKLPDTARTFLGSVDLTLSIGNGPEQKKSVTLTQGMTLPVTVKFDAATVTLAEPNGAAQLTAKPLVDPKHAKWFLNTKFRQAVQHAIDRPSIVKSIFAGRGEGTDGFVSTAYQKWRNPNVVKYAYDVAKAKALLKEIGIEDRKGDGQLTDAEGNVVEFTLNTNTGNNTRDKMAIVIQADLKKLGFKVNYQPIEFNTLVDKIDNSFEYEAILLSLGGGTSDPASSLNVLKSDGFTHMWFPQQKQPATAWEARVDKLMNDQLKTLDFAKRKAIYDEVQEILSRELPYIYTVSAHRIAAYRADLGNVRPTVLTSYRVSWNAEELYFKKK